MVGVMTALPPIDAGQVAEFWKRFVASGAVDRSTPLPSVVEPFGDSAELADELIALVVDGPKRATAGALADYEREQADLPAVGGLSIATDGRAGPGPSCARPTCASARCRRSTTRSRGTKAKVIALGVSWLDDHERYFRRNLPTVGLEFDPDMPTVFERFEVLYSE